MSLQKDNQERNSNGKASRKAILQETSSDESIDLQISIIESTYNIDDDGFNECNADTFDVAKGRFIIVVVYECGKQSSRNYIAKVVKKVEGGYEVEIYKRKIPSYRFVKTNEELHLLPVPM